ncbi:MAG: hypothetical protein JWP81_3220 [Ferruginibacter sp.]|nr:hypothetical protein [Ferruginibacter sp.]
MKTEKLFLPNIAICIVMDLLGMATYAFPLLGEYADIVWAPISALIFNKLFGGRLGLIGGVLNFVEEIVPFTDIIPSFTIAWLIRKSDLEKRANLLKIIRFNVINEIRKQAIFCRINPFISNH